MKDFSLHSQAKRQSVLCLMPFCAPACFSMCIINIYRHLFYCYTETNLSRESQGLASYQMIISFVFTCIFAITKDSYISVWLKHCYNQEVSKETL